MDTSNNAGTNSAFTRLIRNAHIHAGGLAVFIDWLAHFRPETHTELAKAFEDYANEITSNSC